MPLAIDQLLWGEAGPGLLTACIAGGGLVAGVVLSTIGQRRLGPWFVGAGVTMGITLALIAAAPVAVVVIPASIALGAGSLLVMTASQVQVQGIVPWSAGGRVLGTIEGLGFLAMAAGVWATTQMIDGWSLRTSLLVLAAVTLASAIALAWALLRADARVTQARERIGALDGIALFAPLPNALRERIATQLDTLDVAAGGVVTYQGEYGDSFYVVESGTLEVFVDGRQVRSLGPNDFFGEVALLADTTRTATVRAATDCRLWVLPRRVFLSVLTGFAGTGHVITAASTERQAIMPVGANDRDDPSHGSRCSPIWIATRCATSRRRRRPPGTTLPRSCSERTTPPATPTSSSRAGSISTRPANPSAPSVPACSSARVPRCGQGPREPQRPPPRPAPWCCKSQASGSAPPSHDPERARRGTSLGKVPVPHRLFTAIIDAMTESTSFSIDDLLDRAVSAINRGDRAAATALAGQVLAVDYANSDAEHLLAAPTDAGEIRRLTILFADLVDSTVLSTKLEPETYRLLVGRYRQQVQQAVDRYGGHIASTKGDGLLAVFGHPVAHEDDVRRAVQAGLEITRDVARLSEQANRRFGAQINVRVGVHRGLVYLDTTEDDVYGLAANLAARVSSLAPANAVVVSDAVEPLIRHAFEVEALPAAPVKGVEGLINHFRVADERAEA